MLLWSTENLSRFLLVISCLSLGPTLVYCYVSWKHCSQSKSEWEDHTGPYFGTPIESIFQNSATFFHIFTPIRDWCLTNTFYLLLHPFCHFHEFFIMQWCSLWPCFLYSRPSASIVSTNTFIEPTFIEPNHALLLSIKLWRFISEGFRSHSRVIRPFYRHTYGWNGMGRVIW